MDKHPCQEKYPCVYCSSNADVCMLPQCVLRHVTIEGKDGEYAYDELTGRATPWVTVDKPRPTNIDSLDQWYEEWSQRQLETQISSVDTYARVHGRMRAKRHAVR